MLVVLVAAVDVMEGCVVVCVSGIVAVEEGTSLICVSALELAVWGVFVTGIVVIVELSILFSNVGSAI